jgi:hypothetical protein
MRGVKGIMGSDFISMEFINTNSNELDVALPWTTTGQKRGAKTQDLISAQRGRRQNQEF